MDNTDELDYKKIGERIRRYRHISDMTQENLAGKVGISPTHMSHIENGTTRVSLLVLVRIARELDISVDILLNESPRHSKNEWADRIQKMIATCSVAESEILYDTVVSLKATLEKNIPETHRQKKYNDRNPYDDDYEESDQS